LKSRIRRAELATRGGGLTGGQRLDETLEAVRDQFHAFAAEKIAPYPPTGWHLKDELFR